MRGLADRLSQVRITCGPWERVVKPSVLRASAAGDGSLAILLDPPYATSGDLYASTNASDDHKTLSAEVRDWCVREGGGYRIVLCGFDGEHDELLEHGWRVEAGKSGGGAGYNTDSKAGRRERLWLSPECLGAQQAFDFDLDGPRAAGWAS
jgi:hypothetical protein